VPEGLDWFLAYAPWRSARSKSNYEHATRAAINPIPALWLDPYTSYEQIIGSDEERATLFAAGEKENTKEVVRGH